MRPGVLARAAALLLILSGPTLAETFWLDELDLSGIRQGWGNPHARRSVTGSALRIGERVFDRGIGTHAESGMTIHLDGRARRFLATVGVDRRVQQGRGRMEFVVVGDGKILWRSGVLSGGRAPVDVEVRLGGVRALDLVVRDGEDGEDHDHADWARARIETLCDPPRAAPFEHKLLLHPDRPRQTIDHFGASDCWSMQKIGAWPDAEKTRVADLLFDVEKGIGLSSWRFNIGAGINRKTIHHPWRTTESFEVSEGEYDWSRQAGQRWFLRAAKARRVEHFIVFSLSPPGRLTRNRLTNCTGDLGSTNLVDGGEVPYARYLADIVEHFRGNEGEAERIAFDFVSPVNEPQWEWNGGNQEGNRASNEDLRRIYAALGRELSRRGLATRVLAFESGSLQNLVVGQPNMIPKYGGTWGAYLDAFCGDRDASRHFGGVVAAHSYWSGHHLQLVRERRRLRAKLDSHPGFRLWQTEFCILRGPRGESGWGRDLTMKTALWTARVIHYDLTVAGATSWSWWTAVSREDFNDGLIYTDYKKRGDPPSILESRILWTLGNWSRFVRPGMRLIETTGANHGLNGLLASSFLDVKTGRIAVVLVNQRAVPERIVLAGTGRRKVSQWTPYITSDAKGHDLKPLAPLGKDLRFEVPPRSVVTLVGEP